MKKTPRISVLLLGSVMLGCLLAPLLVSKDPAYLDLDHCNTAPCAEFPFGTDSLGRDIFSGIWYGGRISILIGLLASALSTAIALVYGSVSALAPKWADSVMMRFLEIFLSIPKLLLVLFLQAIAGEATVFSLAVIIGSTLWPAIARVVRTGVRQLRSSEYILAAKAMGCSFPHILKWHLAPNFMASISFPVVMNVSSAIATESTLSFLGMGLPLEVISWGSMLSLAQTSLLSGCWWIVIIPGAFLVTLLMCLTNIAGFQREYANARGHTA